MSNFRFFSKKDDPGFSCQCGCGLGFDDMNLEFMLRLDDARHQAGVPFWVVSGARCPNHNSKVSTTGLTGPHAELCAVDLACKDSRHRFIMLEALIKHGFTRLGIAKTFLHVDGSKTKDPKVVWFY